MDFSNYIRDVVFLEQADPGYARGTRFETRAGVLHCDSTERQDWDLCAASFAEKIQAGWSRSCFLKHWGEDREMCAL